MKNRKIKLFNLSSIPITTLWAGLFIASFAMLGFSSLFYINDFASFPQLKFVDQERMALFFELIHENGGAKKYFIGFFIADFVFPLMVAGLLYRYFRQNKKSLIGLFGFRHIYNIALWILAIMVFFDYFENSLHLLFLCKETCIKACLLNAASFFKILFYTLALFLAFLVFHQNWLKNQWSDLWKIFKSSFISALAILVIVALMTQMPQGSSLVIDLFYSPINLGFTLISLTVLALALSHHPSAFLFLHMNKVNGGNGKWVVGKGFWYGWLIYFQKEKDGRNGQSLDKMAKLIRYFIGSFIYFAFIYILLFAYEKYIWHGFNYSGLIVGLVWLKIVLFFFLYNMAQNRKKAPEEEGKNMNIPGSFGKNERSADEYPFFRTYLWINAAHFFLFWAAVGLAWKLEWSLPAFVAVLSFLYLRAIKETYMRLFIPDSIRVVPGNGTRWSAVLAALVFLEEKERTLLASVKSGQRENTDGSYYPVKPLAIKWTAILAGVVLIIAHFPAIGMQISPMLIFILYLHLYYSLVVLILKTYFYFNQSLPEISSSRLTKSGRFLSWLFRNPLPSLIALVAGLGFLSQSTGSNTLLPVDLDTENTLSVNDYINTLQAGDTLNANLPQAANVYIASFGGGLRGTNWNLLLMDHLEANQENFLRNVVAISGVSGGALGQAFYPAIKSDSSTRSASEPIARIGKGNFLSTDLIYLMGWDLLPFTPKLGVDRSRIAMNNYWRMISPGKKMDTRSYQEFWNEAYKKEGHYPALIVNSTNINRRYGLAFSLYSDPTQFDSIFPYSTNILRLPGGKTLSYFDAVSTSERFPFFSNTATIEGLGHFVDGGYFENSGILSLMNFRSYFNQQMARNSYPENRDVLLIINNGSESFAEHVLQSALKNQRDSFYLKVNSTSEFSAVFKGMLSNFELAAYLQTYYLEDQDTGVNAIPLFLPFPLRYRDITDFLKAEPSDTAQIRLILKELEAQEKEIDKAIDAYLKGKGKYMCARKQRWKFAYPTLARLLSRPSYRYSKAMLHHEAIKEQIEKLGHY